MEVALPVKKDTPSHNADVVVSTQNDDEKIQELGMDVYCLLKCLG